MATVNLGKIALKWRGVYDNTATYSGQDVVNEDGTSYIAKADVAAGNLPSTTPASWDVFAQGVEGVTTTAGELIYFDGTNLQALSVGATDEILQLDNNGTPTWSTPIARQGVRAKGLVLGNPHMYRRGACVMTDGSARWWGRGENWMLGVGNGTADRSYPVRSGFPKGAAEIDRMWAEYDYQSVAITTDGKLWQWGQNNYGEVGRGSTADTHVPFCSSDNTSNSINGKTIIDYAPMCSNENNNSTLVLDSLGKVHSCGYNGYGQLGMGDTTQRTTFSEVPILSNITKIARGRAYYTPCMALTSTGTLYSWGRNANGQLGTGNTTQRNIPGTISYFSSIVVTDMGFGQDYAWAIDEDKNLYTWGYNGYGNLGTNNTTQQTTPQLVLTDVVYCTGFSDDYQNTFAVKSDGSVWATGDNSYGSLGTANNTTDRTNFGECKKADGTSFDDAVKVIKGGTGSYNYTHILDSNGIAWSCGYSGNGQIGRGTYASTNYYFSEVLIHRRTVTEIRTIGNSSEGGTMYLLDDGQVLQCGYAGESQLPEDDDENISVPMPVIF